MEKKCIYLRKRYSGSEYDQQYKTGQSLRENRAIARVLRKYVKPGNIVVDLGSGTQLTKRLIGKTPVHYIPVDKYYKEDNTIPMSAEDFLKLNSNRYEIITALFSLNYMKPTVIANIARRCKWFIFTCYNQPYLEGSTSQYTGKKAEFDALHAAKQVDFMNQFTKLKDAGQLVTFKRLLGQPFYYLGVVKGKYERPQ